MLISTRDQVAPIHVLPECTFHPGRPAVVDAKTSGGPWAYLCTRCFFAFGLGLGEGLGQVLIPAQTPHHIDSSTRCHSCGAGRRVLLSGGAGDMDHGADCLYDLAVSAFPDLP